MKVTTIIGLILLSCIVLGSFARTTAACTNGAGLWVNCSVDNSNGIQSFVNTMVWNQGSSGYFLIWVGAYISIAIMLLAQDRSMARFNTITILGLILALVFRMYGLVTTTPVIIAVSLCGLSLLASLFLNR